MISHNFWVRNQGICPSDLRGLLLGCFGAAVVNAEGEGTLKSLLHVGDDTHRSVFVGFQADGKALGILWGEFFALGLDEGSEMIDVGELAVDLNLRGTEIDIDDGRLLLQLLHLGACGYLIAHADIVVTHVGDNHKEEQHGEDEVGHRGQIQPRHLVGTAAKNGLHASHEAPPVDGFDSLIRWG